MSDSDQAPAESRGEEASEATLDKTSRTFDALQYIRTEFVKSVFAELENTIVPEAEAEESAADAAIKQLVQDHLSTFIESKDSMDAVYEQDIALFTGEAFDATEESFENTVMAVVEVTRGLFSLHEGVRSIRLNQDTLAKLVSFLSVPGDIYRFCGCRVLATAAESVDSAEESDSTDDDSSAEASSSSSSLRRFDVHDAAEIPAYVRRQLLPHEEVVVWLGIFLARPKGSTIRTQARERKSKGRNDNSTSLSRAVDFDSAAQSLRLALVFLEDHYDLVEATCLDTDLVRTVSGNDVAAFEETTMQKELEQDPVDANDGETEKPGSKKRASAVHATDFVYRFARALLGSALFLSDAIFHELRRTPCSDSVKTETYLALLMECSTASVKLRHFCIVMRDELLSKSAAGSALNKLQQALDHVDSEDGKSEDGTASETGTVKSAVASVASKLPSEGGLSLQPAAQEGAPPTRRWHPVEAYLGALRDLHNRDISQLCVEWARHGADASWKSESRRIRSAFVSSSPLPAPVGGVNPFAATVSRYEVGNLADSFVVAKGSGASPHQPTQGLGAESPIARENSLAFTSTIRVTGGTELQSDVGTSEAEDSITRSFLREHCSSALLPSCCLKKDPTDTLDEEDEIRAVEQADERTILFGKVNLRAAVSGSVDKLLDHAAHLSLSIEQRTDGVQQIMSNSGGISSPLYSLLRGVFAETEHTVSSYWRGIGTIIHSGAYETNLESQDSLHRAIEGRALERSLMPSNKALVSAGDGDVLSEIPDIRFVPVVTALSDGEEKAKQSLVAISTQTVRRIVESMCELSCRLICSFGRQAAANGFLLSIAGPSAGLRSDLDTRRLEIKASVAYEVLVAHIESFLCIIGETIVQVKTSIGETAHAQSVANDAQVESIVEILTRLEEARTDMIKACLYSLDVLTKAFVLSSCAVVCAAPGSAGSLHARLDPRSVSTSLPVKVFNVALVLADRLTVLFQRYGEVFEGQETMFSSPVETKASTSSTGVKPRRGVKGRGKQQVDSAAKDHSSPGAPDPIASMVSTYNTQLVMKHISSHEELITLLLANLLLTLIDGCHLRCHRATEAVESSDVLPLSAGGGSRSSDPSLDVECLADIYCTSSALPSLISEHICLPTLFALGTRLTTVTASRPVSSTPTPSEAQKNKAKKELFIKFLASQQVDEIAFVAGEGVLDRFATHWMKEITFSVRNVGFIEPHHDWNNPITTTPIESVPGKGSAATSSLVRVRHYLVDTLLHIAGAHEALTRLCVPSIACATVMRLAAHAASVFVSAWNGSSGMELSVDSSPEFFVWGLLLLEAEGLFLVAALKRLSESSAAFLSKSGKVSSEVETARVQEAKTVLQQSLASLEACSKQVGEIGSVAAERIAKSRKGTSLASMSGSERRSARDGAVKQALESSRLLLDALCSHMEVALEPKGGAASGTKGSSTSSMAERLAHRQQGGADLSAAAGGDTSPSKAESGAAGSRFARRLHSKQESPLPSQGKKQSTVLFQEPNEVSEADNDPQESKQPKRMSIAGTTSSVKPATGRKERHSATEAQPAATRGRFQRKGV